MDPHSTAVYFRDEVLDVGVRERTLLKALLNRPGMIVRRERLFEQVFSSTMEVQNDALEVVVYRLRKKLAHTGVRLVTLRGLGYLLKVGD